MSQPQSNSDWQSIHAKHVIELQRRYDSVFRRFAGLDAIVLHSGNSQPKNSRDDQDWPVVATPHFAHWLPYAETPALLVIRPGRPPELVVQLHTSYWEGPGPANHCWNRSSFEITETQSLKDIRKLERCLYIGDDLSQRPEAALSGVEEAELVRLLDSFRTAKTEFEIASLREATRIAVVGHKQLRDQFLKGDPVSELDLHYDYLRATRQRQFTEPYGNIIALGKNAAILHHIHYETEVHSGPQSLLIDAGASFNGLASDITRTWVRGNGEGASLFQSLIAGVESVQQSLCKDFVVGTAYEDLHNSSHFRLAELLVKLQLVKASAEELVSSGATRCLFPHGLGHSLGHQVHDVGMRISPPSADNPYLRNTSIIEFDQVVTIEPGIYFIETLLQKLKSMPIGKSFDWKAIELLKPFGGIRIEDNMWASRSGSINLTREASW